MKPTMADLLANPCPKCGAGAGARCRNYKNKPCAPHRQRKPPKHVPRVQPEESYQESEAIRRGIAGKQAVELAQAASACGVYPRAKYGVYTLTDRAGAKPDRVFYVVSHPGRPGWHTRDGRSANDLEQGEPERLFPPFIAYYRWNFKPGTHYVNDYPPMDGPPDNDKRKPGDFGLRWECRFHSIEVPEVRSAEELKAAAEKRRDKELARQQTEAEKLAEWKARNETPSLFGDNAS